MPPYRYQDVGPIDKPIDRVQRRLIPDYFTSEFAECLSAWANIKRWGMPFTGGWADQPCRLMDVMSEFETLYAEWEHKEAEARKHR